ncbi:hypothetical protein EIP91_008754 [Steccherinum ochraceum]|uniref:EF-hand domain-containing protein n=1 Tax=Steccherinum ochraceum TaxID=92696 RepID=A0A4R0RPL3_9APHY|nr:hypothetical protein EIP91_008754 [Steccherinum ochraceum]
MPLFRSILAKLLNSGDSTDDTAVEAVSPVPDTPKGGNVSFFGFFRKIFGRNDSDEVLSEDDSRSDEVPAESALQDFVLSEDNFNKVAFSAALVSVVATERDEADEKMRRWVHTAITGIPTLKKILKHVAGVHPIVEPAVSGFIVVCKMVEDYHKANAQIGIVYGSIQGMMIVLADMKLLKSNPTMTLQKAVERAADDMHDCAALIKAYVDRHIVVKVLTASSWTKKMADFVAEFGKRQDEMRLGLGLQSIVNEQDIMAHIVNVEAALSRCTSDEEKLAKKALDANHIHTVQEAEEAEENDGLSHIVSQVERATGESHYFQHFVDGLCGKSFVEELREGLDVEKAIRESREALEDTFKQQLESIKDLIKAGVRREDIKDEDLREVWHEMGWKGFAEVNPFLTALREYFQRPGKLHHADYWALPFIHSTWAQPIMEAFDNDGSGYITVSELNSFTEANTLELSLPHWIAYWAVGFQRTLKCQRDYIQSSMNKLFKTCRQLPPENRVHAEFHLNKIDKMVTELIAPLQLVDATSTGHADLFRTYEEHEDQRMRKTLAEYNYRIHTVDMMFAICGKDRVEKYILLMIGILLDGVAEVFQEAQTTPIDPTIYRQAFRSFECIHGAAFRRMKELSELFKQRNWDVDEQFKTYAFGMFDYVRDSTSLWSMSRVIEQSNELRPSVTVPALSLQKTLERINGSEARRLPFTTSDPAKFDLAGDFNPHFVHPDIRCKDIFQTHDVCSLDHFVKSEHPQSSHKDSAETNSFESDASGTPRDARCLSESDACSFTSDITLCKYGRKEAKRDSQDKELLLL